MLPSKAPTSSIPSITPSITGEIASIAMSGIVTDDISIIDITTQFAQIFGVDSNDVETSTHYVTSGVLNTSIPDTTPAEDAITALTESISDLFGVHSKDVVVTIDNEGVVTYSVLAETYADIQNIQDSISGIDLASEITSDLDEKEFGIIVESSTLNDDIELILSATVDTSDATDTVDAIQEISILTQEYGLTDSSMEGIFLGYVFKSFYDVEKYLSRRHRQ